MKKYAIIAAIAAAFFAITGAAQAGYYTTRVVGYDHCGRPVVRTVYVNTSCQPRYYNSYSYRYSRPSYRSYSGSYNYGRSSCRSYSYRSYRCR